MEVLSLKKDIEKQASTRVILRSGFQIAQSRFWQLKPLLKTHHFSVLLSPPKCGFKKNDLESHDIAIVELETNIDLTGRVSEHKLIGPICLPKQGEVWGVVKYFLADFF